MSRHGTYDLKCGFIPDDDCPELQKPQTNADRIRNMTDEELAKWLNPVKCVDCHLPDCGVGEIGNNKTCTERILYWLRQEVDDETGDSRLTHEPTMEDRRLDVDAAR